MGEMINLSRRNFLKVSSAIGGGLLVGLYLPGCGRKEEGLTTTDKAAPESTFEPNAWIRIDTDNKVTILVASSEMGQGVMTAIPMIVADELDADWSNVHAEFAPANNAYANPLMGRQQTGGSTAIRGFWQPLREAGAVARDLLLTAASVTWNVSKDSCRTENGAVIHANQRLSYGQLASKAATLPVPDTAFLKEPKEFTIIGQSKPRLDTPLKVNGSAGFGQDVKIAGILTASVLRCPVFGGKVKSFDAGETKKVKGVHHVLQIGSGIAVVADGFWPAKSGRDVLKVEWDYGQNARLNSAEIKQFFVKSVESGKSARKEGDVKTAEKTAVKKLEAVYEVPYLAHACMEPMTCTAHVQKESCEIWVPTQAQTNSQQTAADITGLPAAKIKINTTFLGGGFGRRGEVDFVSDAVEISKAIGKPVKVLWTREDDTQHDFYRPATYNRLSAAIDKNGMPVAWNHNIAGPSIMSRVSPHAVKNGIDNTSIEGAANLPYTIPNIEVTYAMVNIGVPVGFWRSVGSSQNAYVTECFFDELAKAAGKDPYELRRQLLAHEPRYKQVLELAATKAGWGTPPPKDRFRGIAVAKSFASFVAQVAEVSLQGNNVKVHRVVCAVDCGTTVNPGIIRAQMESAIAYGLSAALKGEITIKDGRVEQSNFTDYPVVRMNEMPEVEVHIVTSSESPGGIGEPGTPPIAPAVANAVFAATGKPVRKLPIRLST